MTYIRRILDSLSILGLVFGYVFSFRGSLHVLIDMTIFNNSRDQNTKPV